MSDASPVAGPTCWRGEALARSDGWIHVLDRTTGEELAAAARSSAGRALETLCRDDFAIPTLGRLLARVRTEVLDGPGIALLKGVPVERLSADEAARALWGIGLLLGVPQPQDASGALLHHVRDSGARTAGRDDACAPTRPTRRSRGTTTAGTYSRCGAARHPRAADAASW
jgi:hypothetical protein